MVYTIINQKKLGSGSYGDVYVVEDETGNEMAVKIIDPKKLSYVELDILTRLKSPYIIKSIGDPIVQIQNSNGITLQLKDNCISKIDTKKLPYFQLKRLMMCCLFGIRCMHSKGFIHNDLVLRNLLYDKDDDDNYVGYIADFSVSIRCMDAKNGVSVTSIVKGSHTPVEIMEGIKERKSSFIYNDKTDMWSLGLCFLEMIDRKHIFSSDSEQMEFYNSIDQDFITGKVRLYANHGATKMSKKEQLYLIELLTNMLRKNPNDRMGSEEIIYLNFVKTSSIQYDCSLNKPSELLVVPTTSEKTTEGIKMIRDYFSDNDHLLLSSYFLSLQIFIRAMNKVVLDNSDFGLEELVEISIRTGRNYYDRSVSAGYEAGIILKGEVGYNPYFYCASCMEELKLVDSYLDQDSFVSMYTFINPYELFYQFKTIYDMRNQTRFNNRTTYQRFSQTKLPDKSDKNKKIYLPSDFSNVMDKKEVKSQIVREKETEQVFNGMIIDYVKHQVSIKFNKEFPDIYQLAMDYVEGGTAIRKKDIYGDIRKKDIFTSLMGINEYFDYGLIKIGMGQIQKNIHMDKKYVIVSDSGKTSLLHVDDEQKNVTHYFSEPNDTVRKFYDENGYDYKMNFEYGINNCCKVVDSCILFLVFYNNYHDIDNGSYEMKCVSEETNFVIFLSLFLD